VHSRSSINEGLGARVGNKVTIGKWRGHKFYRWRASYIEEGRRKKKGFKSEREAKEWAEDKEAEALEFGTAAPITALERVVIAETRETLSKHGLSLLSAIEFAINHHRDNSKSTTVSEAVDRLVEVKRAAKKSVRYLSDIKSRLGAFANDFGSRDLRSISNVEIERWIQNRKQSSCTNNKRRQLLGMMFDRAINDGFLAENQNPARKIELEGTENDAEEEIEVLTPSELSRVLNAACNEILPFFVIGAFAGLRSSEIERLDWSDVDFKEKHIHVKKKKTKTAAGHRLVTINPTLLAWLEPLAKEKGKVYPANGRRMFEIARRAAGFGDPKSLTKKEKQAGLKLRPWPINSLRHSYGSYHLAHHKDAPALALLMGHRNTDLIFDHYRRLVTPKKASQFWALMPKTAGNVTTLPA